MSARARLSKVDESAESLLVYGPNLLSKTNSSTERCDVV